MNHINVFATESDFNAARSSLTIPQLSYAEQEDKIFCFNESQPLLEFEMVNLGLSQHWSNMNAGATCGTTKESWYGGYYSWGERVTKTIYNAGTYTHFEAHETSGGWTVDKVLKYNLTDGYTTLFHDDDPGQIRASAYRSPTPAQFTELLDTTKIEREWKTDYMGVSGLNGVLFTSKVPGCEGNHIFIPACGNMKDDELTDNNVVCLWSNTVDTGYNYLKAYSCKLYANGNVDTNSELRPVGMSAREVSYYI